MHENLKNGIKIMNIESNYLYSANKSSGGYDTKKFWGSDLYRIPEKLYNVQMPYSLALEKAYELYPEEFKTDNSGTVFSDMVISVSFKKSAKIEVSKKKYIIKRHGSGKNVKLSLSHVPRLQTEKNTFQLRDILYENGFILDGNKYVYFMRSASKSRNGTMLFIKEQYRTSMLDEWARLGIQFKEGQSIDVAGMKSYEALVLSGICGKVLIEPHEILLIKDYESVFSREASVTELDSENQLVVQDKITEYRNSIWDGMSLMDSSRYDEFSEFEGGSHLKGKSFVLLRNLWFKSAAFNFRIQEYFRDYNVTFDDIKKHGWTIAARLEDIKLITTPSSLKILKIKEFVENQYPSEVDGQLRSMFEYWLRHIKYNNYFGIVKAEHGLSDHARRCNSQFLMALPLNKNEIRELLNAWEFPRMSMMRNDDSEFLKYIKAKRSHSNSMIIDLASQVNGFTRTDLYLNFKNDTLNDYKNRLMRDGIKIPDSDFCVCVSNPLEMIQYAVGVPPEQWTRIHSGREAYCNYYEDGQNLFAGRNPCVSSGNIVCLQNRYDPALSYLNLSPNIVVLNSINSDIMERASGLDFDSDQMYLSSHPLLVEKAKHCEEYYRTPANRVESPGANRRYCERDFSFVDYQISGTKVGDIVNCGQILQGYYWRIFYSEIPEEVKQVVLKRLYDKISLLSSLSGTEIDRAKRESLVDTGKELAMIRNIGLLDNDDLFMADYIDYGSPENQRKTTITEKELLSADYKELHDAYQQLNDNSTPEEKRRELQQFISDFLYKNHVKDVSKIKTKIRKPLYFKYAFPESKETSIYFDNGMDCPMDYLCMLVQNESPKKKTKSAKINIMDLMIKSTKRANDKHRQRIIEIAEKYDKFCKSKKFHDDVTMPNAEFFEMCASEIKKIVLTKDTVINLFNGCCGSKTAKSKNRDILKIRKHLLDLVYTAHPDLVVMCFLDSQQMTAV